MTFLPIVARELRVSSRRARTYWGRMGIAAAMLCLASWMFLMFHRQAPSQQAFALFATLTGAMLFVGGFAGMAATADSISSEKREGTLGLLFLTPLRGYDVVLGKLVTGSLNVLYGLLSVMPIVALPVLLGGVSGGEFARMSLLLLNTMLLSLCVGIGVSTVCRDEKRSRGMAFLWMALLCGGFPLAGAWLDAEFKLRGLGECLFFPSPGYAFSQAWDATRAGGGGHYWTSMLVIHGVTWLFLLVGCWFAPRTWQDQAMKETGWWQRFRRWVSGIEGEGARAFRTRLLERNAFLWLATRPRFRPAMLWLVLAALTALWLGFGMKYPRDMFHPTMFVFMALAWNGILKVGIASEASRQIASDRKSGSIELLLSTPLSTRDIQRGSWLALQRQFGLPILTVVVAECLLLVLGAHEISQEDDRRVWIVIWISGLCMLMADVAALHIVGLWHSAVAKGPTEAAGATAFRILALPWILYMLLGAAVALTDGLGIFRGLNLGWEFWLASYVVLGFGVDLLFGLKARNAMRTHFREMAAQRMAPRGWGAVLGRMFGRATARRLPAR